MDCGKLDRIEVEKGKPPPDGWLYYGKINVNSCQTDKYLYKSRILGEINLDDMVRVSNPCYNSSVKPKNVEMWVCPECAKIEEEEIDKEDG